MEKNSKGKYTTVHIPTALANLIDEILADGESAYASRSEYIKDAVRRHLEYHGYYPKKKNTEQTRKESR
jgi:Arc/MetJ-type ribon-helix-helix transcriptional regulator